MDITGKIIHALEAKSGVSQRTGNPWMAKDYVLEIPGQYPRHFVFTVFGEEKIKQFALRQNEEVTVQFDVDANEYQGRWFNKVQAWNIIRANQQQPVQQTSAAQYAATTQQPPQPQESGSADDLPF